MAFSIMEIFSPHFQLVIIGNWKTKLQGSLPRAVSVLPEGNWRQIFHGLLTRPCLGRTLIGTRCYAINISLVWLTP